MSSSPGSPLDVPNAPEKQQSNSAIFCCARLYSIDSLMNSAETELARIISRLVRTVAKCSRPRRSFRPWQDR